MPLAAAPGSVHRRRAANIHGVVLPERIERDLTVTEDGTFAFAQTPGAPTVFSDACLMPGLVDAHAPLTIQSPAGDDAPAQDRARASLHANLDLGVLAVREMGARLGVDCPQPRRWFAACASGRQVARCAGAVHRQLGDRSRLRSITRGRAERVPLSGGWVKIVGDWRRPDEPWMQASLPVEALAEAVDRVHAKDGRVAVHACLPDAIAAAISAGADSIEQVSPSRTTTSSPWPADASPGVHVGV